MNCLYRGEGLSRFGNDYNEMMRAVSIVGRHLDKIKKGMKVEPSDDERSIISSAIWRFLQHVMYDPVDEYIKCFGNEFLGLMKEWNGKVGFQRDIAERIDVAERSLNMAWTIVEMIRISKELLKRMENASRYEPPAFSLAKHYEQIIREHGKPISKYEKKALEREGNG